jgi:hypothetical protein
MDTHDSISVDLGIITGFNLFSIIGFLSSFVGDLLNLGSSVTWESLVGMWDINATITSTLHGTEESSPSGGSTDTDIKESFEWSLFIITHVIG